jgi:hypothetical protein
MARRARDPGARSGLNPVRKMELAFGTALLVRGRAGSRPRLRAVRSCSMPGDFGANRAPAGGPLTPLREVSPARCELLQYQRPYGISPETLSSFLMAYPDISVDLEERLSDRDRQFDREGMPTLGLSRARSTTGPEYLPFRSDRFVPWLRKIHRSLVAHA